MYEILENPGLENMKDMIKETGKWPLQQLYECTERDKPKFVEDGEEDLRIWYWASGKIRLNQWVLPASLQYFRPIWKKECIAAALALSHLPG